MDFDSKAHAVQGFYLGLKAKNCDAVSVYYKVKEWIKKNAESEDDLACEIMTSFFVQNCEVFDAPSE